MSASAAATKAVIGTALITGCNRGIGLELARQLAARGTKIYAGVRKASKELSEIDNVVKVVEGVDVSDEKSVEQLPKELDGVEFDLIINNAGILETSQLDTLDVESCTRSFLVNAVGPLLITKHLRKQLKNPSKLVFITSRMGSIADNSSGGGYSYRMSKAALNMGAVSVARDLADDGVAVGILHPGMVQTDMIAQFNVKNAQRPADAAKNLIARIDELDASNSGTFWHGNGEVLPW
eukprot:TRINITY_DN67579_c8_g1_i1.p1 TRINITY_DN67579_c8_g1~~TRINITY_DN67579_c8_g1_i1.p1  ORF type:complete len:237 (+),score=125.40 TRINITY_DN67579_c8_g1_i1:52-762(+)